MGLLERFRNNAGLAKANRELAEGLLAMNRRLADLEADMRRTKDEWVDHHDFVQRAVGRFESRERHDKKKVAAEPEPTDIDKLIREGRYGAR